MKKILILIILSSLFCLLTYKTYAQENNIFGMSLLQPTDDDFKSVATLINGPTGDWGYVTLVIQENDRDVRKWQDIFEKARELHLIPLIRLSTSPQGEVWRRPDEKDAASWVSFLNKLNWVVQNRYVILFNEPNHAVEWGGEVSPESYGKVALAFAKSFKESNADYHMMLAGLDAAAPSYAPQYEDSGVFIKKMFQATNFKLQDYIDAWSSHSYPNPGFVGSVWDRGKKSIRGYEYELNLLTELGVNKALPVFITETGWKQGALSEIQISENFYTAYKQIWMQDNRIQAVTPFVFSYLSEPFIGFSWKKNDGYGALYRVVSELPKQKGTPIQLQKGTLQTNIPTHLIARSTYHFAATLRNEGQAIWSADDGYSLIIQSDSGDIQALISDIPLLKPHNDTRIGFTLKTPAKPQTITLFLQLNNKKGVLLETKKFTVVVEPFPELSIKTSLFPKFTSNGNGFEVQLFNTDEELVFSQKGLTMRKGVITLSSISGIIPGQKYRVVLLGYPYVPRQEIKILNKGENTISLKRLFPFDADNNGRLNLNDIKVIVTHPEFFLRFIPWRET